MPVRSPELQLDIAAAITQSAPRRIQNQLVDSQRQGGGSIHTRHENRGRIGEHANVVAPEGAEEILCPKAAPMRQARLLANDLGCAVQMRKAGLPARSMAFLSGARSARTLSSKDQ
jgi:hypothetical protein